ncbi:MAG TPA: putative DNA-binding domain-containing protein [Nannocystaceae bacterium]|nr:putative DNA-binding domain-containing protein [Nannocystaceae bacterium]
MSAPTDTRERALLDAFAAAMREPADDPITADLPAYLAAHGLVGDAQEALLSAGAERLLMYRTMVQSRLRRVIREFIPRAVARLGDARYRRDFARFFAEVGSRTVYLREVPLEFLAFVTPAWRADPDLPPFLVDLARHELCASEVRFSEGGEAPTGEPLALDRPLRIDGSALLRRYDHAVHRLPQDEGDRTPADAEPVDLLVYRDRATQKVRYLELTRRAGAVLERLLGGATVEAALRGGAAAVHEDLDDDFLAGMVHLFADLSEREVILGAIPAPAAT